MRIKNLKDKNADIRNSLKCFIIAVCMINVNNSFSQSDTLLIEKHLTAITKTDGFRNYENLPVLHQVADYIHSVFSRYADTTYFQTYKVEGVEYKNVVCRFGSEIQKPLIVAGAHYDVCGEQEGADDNASGVVGILELARMLHGKQLSRPVELVAYTLEEPPFFRTPQMGSYIHAHNLKKNNIPVYGMVALEMIGYFSEEGGSQDYPVKPMKLFYGSKGNYILLLRRSGSGEFVNNFSSWFDDSETVNTRGLKAPAKLEGVDFSDHLNYWKMGFDALMVTNTAFYRNKNYHQTTDIMATLDIQKMSGVIDAVYFALMNIDNVRPSKISRMKKGKK
ncbi:M28 family peptidase [Prevotella sp. 10(H)]|uniref:M28 family peptidase n=1 Tax=Prevotella sp. 10(H) TaxID=1158294 RepID=UPI00068A36D3|nr:M28 family peptidase [Prevotella sp. 10(H)]